MKRMVVFLLFFLGVFSREFRSIFLTSFRMVLSEAWLYPLDTNLQPFMTNLSSYVRDTKDILQKLQDIEWQPDFSLATIDVVSLYTSIKHTDGLTAVSKCLSTRSVQYLTRNAMILDFLKFSLQNNYFLFDGNYYLQLQGTAMGAKFAPPYACILMGAVENHWLWSDRSDQFIKHIIFWGRYIDDILLIWQGSEAHLQKFIQSLTPNPWEIEVTYQISKSSIEYLDLLIYVEDNKLMTKFFRKKTSANSILHATSCHSASIIRNIPKGEFRRARLNCSNLNDYDRSSSEMTMRLVSRGYNQASLNTIRKEVRNIDRNSLLNTPKKNNKNTTIRFITAFHNGHKHIRKSLKKYWFLLANNSSINQYISSYPQIGFRRAPNLRNKLCPSFFQRKVSTTFLPPKPAGFYTCSKCSICKLGLSKPKTVSINNCTHRITDFINCSSTFVIYAIWCPCNLTYIGSTTRPLKIRIQEHFRNIHKSDTQAPMVEHFNKCHQHQRTFTFCGLRRIIPSPRGGNTPLRLRQEESRLIIKYDTVNNGLNKDYEWHFWLT
ncbi:hypothetical protein NDU88_005969 [Pleurodeles waltl]|uniref:Reverse transcriptase domain-containing protein n=1 Tax=Pleurodeles waltl TaxID=8319 RepID=A0AAV7UMK8_PLEWA|nr:hypothetical protein NDU88_005969 [Pleurodeles waltl]